MIVQRLPAEEFLAKARHVPVIDVRSPSEYLHGHIPGAYNIPLFDDLERADVGTLFHKAGREEAVKKGLEIVGPKMRVYVDEALKMATTGELLVYCWRGGMRSDSMAWLFNTSGIKASVLEKGYKGFRKYIRSSFEKDQPIIIVGGRTGSGKTTLLHKISDFAYPTDSFRQGFQTIDLEQLANHKGSVFGSLGLPEQPTNEHFQNLLGMAWFVLDPEKPVFMEDESLNIGRDAIPLSLYKKMQVAPLIYVDMPFESRVERLFGEYAHFPGEVLKEMIDKITKRLGGANAKAAKKAIDENRLKDAIRISLIYYDKAYGFDVGKRDSEKVFILRVDDEHVEVLAEEMFHKMKEIIPA